MSLYVEVAVAAPVRRTFHYLLPGELAPAVRPGTALAVPFGRRRLTAYALSLPGEVPPPDLAPERLKPVCGLKEGDPGLPEQLLPLARWMARRYFAPLGEVIQAMLPAPVRHGGRRRREAFVLPAQPRHQLESAVARLASRSPRQAAILELLAEAVDDALPRALVLRETGASSSSLQALLDKGLLRLEEREPEEEPLPSVVEPGPPVTLTGEQRRALEIIRRAVSRPGGAALLFGITGSGKTELYLRLVAEVVATGRQAIVLVPEISLTPQTVERFRARFRRVAVLHSHLTPARRARYWERIRSGEVEVVIGARSAVFAPFPRLGLIVVDEEHETSYKQENSPRYHAVEVALQRARLEGAGVLLGSATPSLESLQRAKEGRLALALLTRRPTGGTLPPVEVVDMRTEIEKNRRFVLVSRRLRTAVEETLEAGEQVILFLNRRGFSTRLYCPACGYVATCPQCDVAFTYHRQRGLLVCHYCDRHQKPPSACPLCGSERLLYLGTGTERVEEVLGGLFPQARIARLDSDVARHRRAYFEILGAFRSRHLDVLVGTQMIAKGLDFPGVSLVGVVNADVALNLADFRAAERTVQIVSQVAGRAGRSSARGRVVVQSASPQNPALLHAARHDYRGFAEKELEKRRLWGYPPFRYLVRIVLSGPDAGKTRRHAADCARALAGPAGRLGVEILGPAPCVYRRLRGRHRFHLLLKAPEAAAAEALLEETAETLTTRRGVEVTVDVNPQSML